MFEPKVLIWNNDKTIYIGRVNKDEFMSNDNPWIAISHKFFTEDVKDSERGAELLNKILKILDGS